MVILPLLLSSSCASSPNWTGAETAAGEFVWTPSPGFRLYVNVVLLGGVFVYFIYVVIRTIRNWQTGDRGLIGCFSFFLLLIGLFLFASVRDYIWYESFSINQDRIERAYYTTVWKTEKKTETLEWKNVKYIGYIPEKYLESTTWIKVNPVTRERVGKGQTEEGMKGRVIHFRQNDDKIIEIVLEKQSYNTEYPQFMRTAWSWIFGSEDYAVTPEEERRLKAAINKYLPENVKQTANAETKEYLKQE
jgi:hypothetical protein